MITHIVLFKLSERTEENILKVRESAVAVDYES